MELPSDARLWVLTSVYSDVVSVLRASRKTFTASASFQAPAAGAVEYESGTPSLVVSSPYSNCRFSMPSAIETIEMEPQAVAALVLQTAAAGVSSAIFSVGIPSEG